jgi:hypothetical protein
MLMMKKHKDLEFEPVHPKNVLLASVVHGISCLLKLNKSKFPKPFGTYLCSLERLDFYLLNAGRDMEKSFFVFE